MSSYGEGPIEDPEGLLLLARLPIPMASVDADGRVTFINERAIQLSGYTREDVPTIGAWRERAFPDPAYRHEVRDRWESAVARAVAAGHGDIEPVDIRLRTKSGEVREATLFGLARRGGLVVLFVDHTERNRSEARRVLSEQRFRDVVDAAGEYVWECDPGFRYTWLSHKVHDVFGHAPEEMLGRRPTDFMPEGEYEAVKRDIAAMCQADGSYRGIEHRSVRRGGEVFWQRVSAVVVRDAQGRIVAYRGTGRDITAQKQAEADRGLLEPQVREAQKLQALGTLAGGVAHEFNNLLAVILGHTALARGDAQLGEATRENLLAIEEAARDARHLVSQLLAIGRQQPRSLTRIALAPVVQECLRLLEPALPEGVRLRHEVTDGDLQVAGDPAQLRQVLLNLGLNAAHAMRGRPGCVRMSLHAATFVEDSVQRHQRLRAGRYACLAVTDEGCGMDAPTQQRIFEPFFTTKPLGQGTGLGLSVVDGIVHSHAGVVLVHSEPGRGSTFLVYLPLTAP
jgi:PAS domain S-box-containing protein